MKHARFVYGIALENALAMASDGQCVSFKISPRMFTGGGKLVETQGELDILNAGGLVNEGDEVAAIQDLSGFWTRISPGGHWEVEAEIQSVGLKATDTSGTADYISVRQSPVGACSPPGVVDGQVEFENPWRLDAQCGSKVILEYIEDVCKPEEDRDPRWELRQVEKYRARWIKFRFLAETPSDISILDYWEGEDPEACNMDVDVQYPLGQPCIDSDVVACYDPFTFTYRAISSESAMLGPAETMDIVQAMAFDECGINYMKQQARVFPCGSQPTLIQITPTLTSVDVLTGADFEYTAQTCSTSASWSWNSSTSTWDVVTPCEAGCTATSVPALPPGPWNGFAVSHTSPCTRQTITGLQFSKSVVQVCAFMTTGPDIIPITQCPTPP